MRSKPSMKKIEKTFIEGSAIEEENKKISETREKSFLDKSPQLKWPVIKLEREPSMEEGGSLRRPINLPLKEFEWNTLENHTKKLGVGKTEWIRYAIYKLLVEEQKFYFSDIEGLE